MKVISLGHCRRWRSLLQLPAGLDGLIDENCSRLALDVLVASHHSWVWIHSSSLSCEFQPGECRLYSVLLTCVGCRCHQVEATWSGRDAFQIMQRALKSFIRPWNSGNPWRHTSMGKAGRTIFFPQENPSGLARGLQRCFCFRVFNGWWNQGCSFSSRMSTTRFTIFYFTL